MAVVCNVLWGSAFPFIKLGYRLFAIDSADTASILCFAGVRFMMGAALVWLAGLALNRRPLPMPHGKTLASACGLGLWQTAAQYFFYYSAVALLTGAMGGILNSTQSFMGVILAHFLYGKADRMTPRKALGCALGFCGVLIATLGNHGSGSAKGMAFMLIASAISALPMRRCPAGAVSSMASISGSTLSSFCTPGTPQPIGGLPRVASCSFFRPKSAINQYLL